MICGPRERYYTDAFRETRKLRQQCRLTFCPREASAAIAAPFKRRSGKFGSDYSREVSIASLNSRMRRDPTRSDSTGPTVRSRWSLGLVLAPWLRHTQKEEDRGTRNMNVSVALD